MKLKKGDNVVVIAGKDLGKTGSILDLNRSTGKVKVSGINKIKKAVKKTANSEGGIIEMEKMLNASNIAIIDPKTGKPSRIGYRINKTGSKERYAKQSGTILPETKISTKPSKK